MGRIIALMGILTFTFHAPAMAKEKPKVLFLDLTATLVKPEEGKILTDMVGAELGQYEKYDIITSADLRQMAALEADKQSAGCVDSSCLAELAGAMGARYVIFGSVGKLGDKFILTLNLFDSVEAKSVARHISKAKGLGEMADKIPDALKALLARKKLRNDMASSEPQESEHRFPWLQAGAASAFTAVGAGLALGWGLPAYLDMTTKENSIVSESTHNSAAAAQSAYHSGPVYGLIGGGIFAIAAGSYTTWLIMDHFSEE